MCQGAGVTGLVEFLEHGGAQLVQGQPVGLDQQPDRAGAAVGEAIHGPLPSLHRVAVGGDLDRVLGIAQQCQQPVQGGGVLTAGGGLLAEET